MRIDATWLTELLDGEHDLDTLAERLTHVGFTVELRDQTESGEVWDVEITTNRPDAMNHRGLAREAAVATGGALRPLAVDLAERADDPAAGHASVTIEDPEGCSRYAARIIRGVTVRPSPAWLAARLERCGVRPINAVVDATNLVLMELGQPLHAFDLETLEDRRIVVRRAAEGERLVTLDGEERQLDPSMLVIADARRPVALAGIMGGADTEIGETTTDILLESAHFDPVVIRRAARRLGMHTEASHRFERGCDPQAVVTAADLAAALIAEFCGGTVCAGVIDTVARPWTPREISFSLERLCRFAGLEVPAGRVVAILEGLGFSPRRDGDRVSCTVPSWRVDVELAEDLYEEVIRHVGYDAVPSVLPVLSSRPGGSVGERETVDHAREAALDAGLDEVVTYAFIDPEDDGPASGLPLCPGEPLPLVNPLSRNQATMRRSLLPGLVTAAREMLNRGERELSVFEQGRAFATVDGTPVEVERLGVVLAGPRGPWDARRETDFLDLKGVVEELCRCLGLDARRWERGGAPWLDEAEGVLVRDGEGRVLAVAGRLAPAMADRWDLKVPLYLAELDLTAAGEPAVPTFEPLPRHPAVTADLTVEHDRGLEFATLEERLHELASELVERIELVVRYEGKNVPRGRVRTTVRLVYRHPERSLTQEEVNEMQNRLRERLAAALDVRLV